MGEFEFVSGFNDNEKILLSKKWDKLVSALMFKRFYVPLIVSVLLFIGFGVTLEYVSYKSVIWNVSLVGLVVSFWGVFWFAVSAYLAAIFNNQNNWQPSFLFGDFLIKAKDNNMLFLLAVKHPEEYSAHFIVTEEKINKRKEKFKARSVTDRDKFITKFKELKN